MPTTIPTIPIVRAPFASLRALARACVADAILGFCRSIAVASSVRVGFFTGNWTAGGSPNGSNGCGPDEKLSDVLHNLGETSFQSSCTITSRGKLTEKIASAG